MSKLQKQIIQEFGSPLAQKLYVQKAEVGLWGSEEILIKKYFQSASSVLEIGCGTGRVTIPLYRMKYQVTAIDVTPAMLGNARKIAKRKGLNINYQNGDARKLELKNATFDNVIFCFNGWSQIPGKKNRYQVLQEVYRVLKPGGYYVFMAALIPPRHWAFWIRHFFKLGISRLLRRKTSEIEFGDYLFHREHAGKKSTQTQLLHFSRGALVKKQIEQAGFKLIDSGACNDLSTKNTPDWPNLPCGRSPTYYVCQKPKSKV
jgi:ubiquinone/menaquinone biosynthesis C-methylase UbiE